MQIKALTYLGIGFFMAVPPLPASADNVYWDDGGSHVIDDATYRTDWVHLDYNIPNDAGTHVDLLAGGEVGMLSAYNNASITMTGGWSDYIHCKDDSTIDVTGGNATIAGSEHAIISVSGGDHGGVGVTGNATLYFFDGGYANSAGASGQATASIMGGHFNGINATESGIVALHKCQIEGLISGSGDSSINIHALDMEKYTTGGFLDNGYMSGHWLDGTEFQVDFGHPDTFSHVFLVPEPTIFCLLIAGCSFRNKRKR